MGPLDGNNHTTNCRRVLYACGAQVQICQTFVRQANESGLYDVDSSWPTECGHGNGQSEERTQSTAANRESVCNRNKQRHENSMITQTTAISTDFSVHRARGRRPQRVARSNRQ
ncbi:hypothetical protein T01_4673 [Trichinella spiralis]|uniref:Uncharacterized protein n=1 Tax=Trichinella spiralis TaxID=6334 RepID=A0A0V1B7M3_TRISP|nr:hypothetical protein T01_4673 [Trichinella spiralis]